MQIERHLRSRPVAIAALMGVIALGTFATVSRTTSMFEAQRERLDQSLSRLATFRAQVATKVQLERQLQELKHATESLSGLMKTESASVAAAQLQGELKAIVEKNRGEVRTTQILASTAVHGFEQVTIKSELSVPFNSLRDVVYAVETHTPFFFIERMAITAPRDWPAENERASEPKLEINWTIHAFRWSEPA